jgi:hypothetical protein
METEASLSVRKSPLPVPILCQMNPVHTLPRYVSKILSNIVHVFTFRSSELYLPIRLAKQNFV